MKDIYFNNVLENFIKHLNGIKNTLPLTMYLLNPYLKNTNMELENFIIDRKIQVRKEGDGKETLFIPIEIEPVFSRLMNNVSDTAVAIKLIPESLFVSLISQFDSLMGNLIRVIYQIKPEILNDSQKILSYSQIARFKNLDEAREYIIEKEVDSILRESHTDQFTYLENKLGMTLRKDLLIWPHFIEITERRNLFVHCDGVVNNQYINICRQNKVKDLDCINLGDKLGINPKYFRSAYICMFEIAVKLVHTIWRKLNIDDLLNADIYLNDIAYDLLEVKDYVLADTILEFASGQKKHYNEETQNVFLVNCALSKYLQGDKEKSIKMIKQKDWSASNDKFKMAYYVLMENDKEVYKLMKKIGNNGDISKNDYKYWPLFTSYRTKPVFIKNFSEIFNENYIIEERPLPLIEKILGEKTNKKLPDKSDKKNIKNQIKRANE